MKSSTDFDVSYSFSMQYGGDVIVKSIHPSGICRISSMQSPVNNTVSPLMWRERIAKPVDLCARMFMIQSIHRLDLKSPPKTAAGAYDLTCLH